MKWSWRSGRGSILDQTESRQLDGDLKNLTVTFLVVIADCMVCSNTLHANTEANITSFYYRTHGYFYRHIVQEYYGEIRNCWKFSFPGKLKTNLTFTTFVLELLLCKSCQLEEVSGMIFNWRIFLRLQCVTVLRVVCE